MTFKTPTDSSLQALSESAKVDQKMPTLRFHLIWKYSTESDSTDRTDHKNAKMCNLLGTAMFCIFIGHIRMQPCAEVFSNLLQYSPIKTQKHKQFPTNYTFFDQFDQDYRIQEELLKSDEFAKVKNFLIG